MTYDELTGDEDDDGRVGGGSGVSVEGRDAVLDSLERKALRRSRPSERS